MPFPVYMWSDTSVICLSHEFTGVSPQNIREEMAIYQTGDKKAYYEWPRTTQLRV